MYEIYIEGLFIAAFAEMDLAKSYIRLMNNVDNKNYTIVYSHKCTDYQTSLVQRISEVLSIPQPDKADFANYDGFIQLYYKDYTQKIEQSWKEAFDKGFAEDMPKPEDEELKKHIELTADADTASR